MSRDRTDMHRLQELVRLHRLKTGYRKVATMLKMSPNTERDYRKALKRAGILDGDPDDLPELAALKAIVLQEKPLKPPPQQVSKVEPWRKSIEAMVKKGAQPKAIYDCLRLEKKDFDGSLGAVKRMVRQLKKAQGVQPGDVSITVETAPGKIAQVDFGYVGKLYDPLRGLLRKAWVFVMVLGYSRHQFGRIVFDQRIETWLQLHVEAFEAFGGVVDTVVPDNLKSAVIKAAFGLTDQPALNRSYRELARAYKFKIDPTPPRDPRKKGKVEAGVKYAKNNFIKPRDFADIDDANRRLASWVYEIAGQRDHGTTGRKPLEVFEQVEKETLEALPAVPYIPVIWKPATVHQDGQFLFDRRPYAVPWRLIGEKVWLRTTPTAIEVHVDHERVVTHERGKPVPDAIRDAFLPPERAHLRHRSRSYWVGKADALGDDVGTYIREVFDSDDVLSMLRTVQGMVTLLEKHPLTRAQAACRRAQYYANYTYPGLRDILRKGLDLQPLPNEAATRFGTLEQPRFARAIQELLPWHKEAYDESH